MHIELRYPEICHLSIFTEETEAFLSANLGYRTINPDHLPEGSSYYEIQMEKDFFFADGSPFFRPQKTRITPTERARLAGHCYVICLPRQGYLILSKDLCIRPLIWEGNYNI